MRLFNDYISLVCSDDRLSVSLEKLNPSSHNGPVTLEMVQGFLEHKKVHHVKWDLVKSILDKYTKKEQVKNKQIVELPHPKISSNLYGEFDSEAKTKNWLGHMNLATHSWKRGIQFEDLPVSFYSKGDVILSLTAPAETDCFGDVIKTWNPTKWLMYEKGIQEVVTGSETQLVAKYDGYLFSEENTLSLKQIEILSHDEMMRSALLLIPENSKSEWTISLSNIEKKYDVKLNYDQNGIVELERGSQPVPAKSGTLEEFVLNNGAWFEEVFQGQTLYTVSPSKEAIPGMTVTQKKVDPPKVKKEKVDLAYSDGVYVELDEKGFLHYKAKMDGVVQKKGQEIFVKEVLSVSKNLSVYMSPIYYNGPVEVQGDILEGVFIQCHDLSVNGMIENNVNIEAKNHVNVVGGVIGAQTMIQSEHFLCHHIQDATVRTKGQIEVNSYAYRANLYSAQSIVIKGERLPKGHQALVGGITNAFDHIQAHSIGSKMCTTMCAVGLDLELWEKCEKAKEDSRKLYKQIQSINKEIPIDLIKNKNKNELSQEKQELIAELLQELKQSMKKREQLIEQLNQDKQNCFNVNKKEVYIEWKSNLKPDVIVMVGDIERQLRSSMNKATRIKESNQKIKLDPLNE